MSIRVSLETNAIICTYFDFSYCICKGVFKKIIYISSLIKEKKRKNKKADSSHHSAASGCVLLRCDAWNYSIHLATMQRASRRDQPDMLRMADREGEKSMVLNYATELQNQQSWDHPTWDFLHEIINCLSFTQHYLLSTYHVGCPRCPVLGVWNISVNKIHKSLPW